MTQQVPVHLGLILDGNRRWARAQGLPLLEGHRVGHKNLQVVATRAFERGVKYISAYVFSTENWNRAKDEVAYLMDLFISVATNEIDQYVADGVKVVFVGSRAGLNNKLVRAMETAEAKTRHNTRGILAVCFNYGGQMELAEGVAQLVRDGVPADEITPKRLAEYLYHPEIPALDFIIRTSGEQRLSNFMLWRAAYAELYFTPVHWPEFTSDALDEALEEYATRQRRYGAS
jgi:undecaprenyl diphosphate synthase